MLKSIWTTNLQRQFAKNIRLILCANELYVCVCVLYLIVSRSHR